ncbi:hypothetical protein Misp01_80650 [Microtetraspora sp. NBRC 13810]|uniref:hypothetical protein n=1 Tax=Microtetraspora sp. NBRC 13810 TaxID=3030990 RepID=UPI0024A26BCC|nr:hypothetical protein [Microtetraspora sp. NBRC 13810]GLW12937.1 hypothetical protein Misp01_80650 [Microtetraspora sp. NBRC 13810]
MVSSQFLPGSSARRRFAEQFADLLRRAGTSQAAFARRLGRQLEQDGHLAGRGEKNLAPRVHDWISGVTLPSRRWVPSLLSALTDLCRERGVPFRPGVFAWQWSAAARESRRPPE